MKFSHELFLCVAFCRSDVLLFCSQIEWGRVTLHGCACACASVYACVSTRVRLFV